jgi:hypothetical protein
MAEPILDLPAVSFLLELDPPLETKKSERYEQLDSRGVGKALENIRNLRTSDPRAAMTWLGWILKRIRDRRAHHVKSRSLTRNAEILAATREILDAFVHAAVEVVFNDHRLGEVRQSL